MLLKDNTGNSFTVTHNFNRKMLYTLYIILNIESFSNLNCHLKLNSLENFFTNQLLLLCVHAIVFFQVSTMNNQFWKCFTSILLLFRVNQWMLIITSFEKILIVWNKNARSICSLKKTFQLADKWSDFYYIYLPRVLFRFWNTPQMTSLSLACVHVSANSSFQKNFQNILCK